MLAHYYIRKKDESTQKMFESICREKEILPSYLINSWIRKYVKEVFTDFSKLVDRSIDRSTNRIDLPSLEHFKIYKTKDRTYKVKDK